ncbi:MAG: DUF3168 domain-containing protein [Methylocystis sp.]|jgi:hypothetical protein|nr:DUF3168 domain-containing protein [Methylocystis sp.]MCA3582704.1 DUF3168 domain-containing protein [Methylocystis sp.]MCA3587090.1 DUF3168 domain-containing protein [Methylocystis sp.]MCA3592001.1 DUF3168 domain-containing protein [Methylocystis sp.]
MTSPAAALKEAIRARLAADAGVLALLREPKVHLDPPRHVAYPFIACGEASQRDNGTSSEDGHITELAFAIWSRGGGSAEGLAIADAAVASLTASPLSAAGHRVVNLVVLGVQPQPLKEPDSWRTTIRLRIVTEVL